MFISASYHGNLYAYASVKILTYSYLVKSIRSNYNSIICHKWTKECIQGTYPWTTISTKLSQKLLKKNLSLFHDLFIGANRGERSFWLVCIFSLGGHFYEKFKPSYKYAWYVLWWRRVDSNKKAFGATPNISFICIAIILRAL